MILKVSKSYIQVELKGRVVTVLGEMFFPAGDKMGFAIYKNEIKFWDAPHENQKLKNNEIIDVIREIQEGFIKGGHILEVEP